MHSSALLVLTQPNAIIIGHLLCGFLGVLPHAVLLGGGRTLRGGGVKGNPIPPLVGAAWLPPEPHVTVVMQYVVMHGLILCRCCQIP